ncbi:DUF4041 domain-containing protein [Brevibacillus borstelensis]|uniref:DUF4041 domain-containing protein n=1 Tax=Brevibacillus borstelensis TaxID=45462 RepID=UPI002041A28B|nr:DUF4041 domain-containing protein [Brevibacillus borstelensis]MCM3560637.1 DUF4041 domain-containing protein [Brevibacillus borstelensis]
MDIFRISKIKEELEALKKENHSLKALVQPEHQEIIDLKREIENLSDRKNLIIEEIEGLDQKFKILSSDYEKKSSELHDEIEKKKNQILFLDETLMLESFSLYEPKYDFQNSEEYKRKLEMIREQQKEMIKKGWAASGNSNWTVNNSKTEGRKMVNDMVKLLLRSFNNECDSCVERVKFNNIESCEKRIISAYDAINKLGRVMNVSIAIKYKDLKLEELYLAYEYKIKKQEEKEEQKRIREQMREEAKLQKEIEEVRKQAEKEKKHYENALEKAKKQLEGCKTDEERSALLEKIESLNLQLTEIDKQLKEVDYREANQRAGYVYVISNIGSFGENVYKIGMTRRLDPYDRIYELGDASVPFDFDVHAMIFSDDAPKLEATLHKAFEDRKLNMINTRREFFHVTLDEIEEVITRNHDKTVEFIKTSDAKEYRESLKIRQTVISEIAQREIAST